MNQPGPAPAAPTGQGTVWSFDADQRTGTVVLDDGSRFPFGAGVFDASGLRLVRPGQRVRVTVSGDAVTEMTILTLHPPR